MTMTVLGRGCANCHRVETVAGESLRQPGNEAEVNKATDYEQMMRYSLLAMPGLMINERSVCAGRILTVAETTSWLANALEVASPSG